MLGTLLRKRESCASYFHHHIPDGLKTQVYVHQKGVKTDKPLHFRDNLQSK
jgi:hypothetical protein